MALLVVSTGARASTFDATSGKLSLDGAWSTGFDTPQGLALSAFDIHVRAVSSDALAARFATDSGALEGAGAFFVGGDVYAAKLDLAALVPTLGGRRVNVRVWTRPSGPDSQASSSPGTAADVYLSWTENGAELVTIRFVPSGRGTDDGWRELETGPIDFALGHRIAPSVLFLDAQYHNTTLDAGSEFPASGVGARSDARAAIDALEITDLGPAKVPDAACTLPSEATTCGAGGVCLSGRCADASAVLGPVLQDADIRKAFVDRVRFAFRTFSGIRYALAHMAEVDGALATAETTTDPASFYLALRAIEALRDAHSSPPAGFRTAAPDLGICLGVGAADLLPGGDTTTAVPIVYQSDPKRAGGALVQPGDVLTKIDGVPVATWTASAKRLMFIPGDPRARPVYEPLLLPAAAASAGAKLEFSRCDRDAHSSLPCTAAEVQTITVDTAALSGDKIWGGSVVGRDLVPTPCDPRFTRPIPGAQTYAYAFAGSVDLAADTRVLFINGVPSEAFPGGSAWKTAVTDALSVSRPKFILDEREGNGGSAATAFPLIFGSMFGGPVPLRAELIPNLEGAPLEDALTAMRRCALASSECADYMQLEYPGQNFSMNNAAAKLAIVSGLDVSGNDFLTRLLKTRAAATRVFGPVPTMGGYGSVALLPSYRIVAMGGSLQIHDSIFTTNDADPNRAFESAVGVVPDEIVLQKQSDAIVGTDSVMDAARRWVDAP